MSDASSKQTVECPICGDEFDPTVAGGWCTNTECGEWQHTEDSSDETVAEGTEEPDDDGFVSPADEEPEESESVDLFGESDEDATDEDAADDEGAAVDDEGDAADAEDEEAPAADAEEAAVDDTEEEVDESATIDCPDCEAELEADANFCVECGADVSDVTPDDDTELDVCPECGADVESDDSFCVGCGEDLDAYREGDTEDADAEPSDSLVLAVESREIHVTDDDTVGREIRAALTEAGRPDDEAVRIHREHVRFVHENGTFYLLEIGRAHV